MAETICLERESVPCLAFSTKYVAEPEPCMRSPWLVRMVHAAPPSRTCCSFRAFTSAITPGSSELRRMVSTAGSKLRTLFASSMYFALRIHSFSPPAECEIPCPLHLSEALIGMPTVRAASNPSGNEPARLLSTASRTHALGRSKYRMAADHRWHEWRRALPGHRIESKCTSCLPTRNHHDPGAFHTRAAACSCVDFKYPATVRSLI
mmetsp:Transcript_20637/g.39229  ORF Transcript_20637/g.39229 Transcript_20637/m.39229 type:complete len:207 (+) Transcript_20637:363-983(+)